MLLYYVPIEIELKIKVLFLFVTDRVSRSTFEVYEDNQWQVPYIYFV